MSDREFANTFPDYAGEKLLNAQGKVRATTGNASTFHYPGKQINVTNVNIKLRR